MSIFVFIASFFLIGILVALLHEYIVKFIIEVCVLGGAIAVTGLYRLSRDTTIDLSFIDLLLIAICISLVIAFITIPLLPYIGMEGKFSKLHEKIESLSEKNNSNNEKQESIQEKEKLDQSEEAERKRAEEAERKRIEKELQDKIEKIKEESRKKLADREDICPHCGNIYRLSDYREGTDWFCSFCKKLLPKT